MGGIMNGLAAHGGVLPVGGTFFVFSDYMRGAVRLAALSQAKVIYSWTHDSVGVGEDGPTHQPVEHLAALRAMPGLRVIRPADANETAEAWRLAVDSDGPTALILSRQNVPVLDGTAGGDRVVRGGYVLREPEGADPQVVLVSTGSEVWVCPQAAAEALAGRGHPGASCRCRAGSPLRGPAADYREEAVLPPRSARLSVEAATTFGWSRWADDSPRHRPLPAPAPPATWCSSASGSPPRTWRPGAGAGLTRDPGRIDSR